MSNTFVDNFKLRSIIEESITSLRFLDSVKVQDDISSELAGFEISKLLKNQQENQHKYAQLVKKRATLTQITQKDQLAVVEAQIAHLSIILKESTKKLCKLFKQNPDLERDSLKVSRERRMFIVKLEQLIQFIRTNQTPKFQTFIARELEDQDLMRKLMQKEKNLKMEIKRIQQEKMFQNKQYQKEIQENQARIQQFKENLMDKKKKTDLEVSYFEKQSKAQLANQKRLYLQSEKTLQVQIEKINSTFNTQTLVHSELDQYLNKKNAEIKKKSQDLTNKTQQSKDTFQQEINQLNALIAKTTEELDQYKIRYQQEEAKKIEREIKEKNKQLEKKKKEEHLIRLNNAIKYIQNEFMEWKETGGRKKKKKKKTKK